MLDLSILSSWVINIVDDHACLEYAKEIVDGKLTAATDCPVLTASYIAQKWDYQDSNMKSQS